MNRCLKFLATVVCLLLSVSNSTIFGTENGNDDITVDPGVGNSFMFSVGEARRADTYLSPLHYKGWSAGLAYEHTHGLRKSPWLWTLESALWIDRTENPARNAAMWGAQLELRWDMMYRLRPLEWLEVDFGPGTSLDVGALYLNRNGNNPVAANASWTLDVDAQASASFRLGKVPVTARYHVSLPFVGAMFAPDYGQLYYEIYLGDSHGIFSAAYWGRYFRLRQLLTFDIGVCHKWLRIGYGPDIVSTRVNGIVGRRITHNFVIGITTDLVNFDKHSR